MVQPPVVRQDTAPVHPMLTVIVANAPLKFGTTLTVEMLAEVPWPAGSIPAGSFSNMAALVAGGPRVVVAAIAKHEPILASKVSAPGQRPSLALMIEEGKKAVAIRVDDVLGVAGFVQPDDRVDVLLTRAERAGGRPGAGSSYTDLLLQDTRVLAIDQLADRNTQAKPVKTVTLEVGTEDAQKLVLAASVGQLSLALRGSGAGRASEARRIGLEDLPSTPRQPEAAVVVQADEKVDRGPTVTVFRGITERKQYDVSPEAKQSMLELLAADEKVKSAGVIGERDQLEAGPVAPQPR